MSQGLGPRVLGVRIRECQREAGAEAPPRLGTRQRQTATYGGTQGPRCLGVGGGNAGRETSEPLVSWMPG